MYAIVSSQKITVDNLAIDRSVAYFSLVSADTNEARWKLQGLHLAEPIYTALRAEADRQSTTIKSVGNAALACFLGLPPRVRRILVLWLETTAAEGDAGITPEGAHAVMEAAMAIDARSVNNAEWFAEMLRSAKPAAGPPLVEPDTHPRGAAGHDADKARRPYEHYVDRILDPSVLLPRATKMTRKQSKKNA